MDTGETQPHPYIEAQKDRAPRAPIDGRLLAARLRRESDKYESNATGMSDERGAVYDDGWVAGMRHAAEVVEQQAAESGSSKQAEKDG